MTIGACLWNHSSLSPLRVSHALIRWSAPHWLLKYRLWEDLPPLVGAGESPEGLVIHHTLPNRLASLLLHRQSLRPGSQSIALDFFLLPHHLKIRKRIQHLEPRCVQDSSSHLAFLFSVHQARKHRYTPKTIFYSL